MQFKICLFCKRSLEHFCYSIYDSANQPYVNIMQLFGDVEDNLRHGRHICHECLYIIRWIYFMKKILADALTDEDIGENNKVIPAFNIFKMKINQPIYVLADEGNGDIEDNFEECVLSSNIQSMENADSENECRPPRNPQDYVFSNGGGKPPERLTENENVVKLNNDVNSCQDSLGDSSSSWWPTKHVSCNISINDDVEAGGSTQKVNCRDNRLMYSCNIKVCKHTCDTFEDLKSHYFLHNLIEQSDLTLESYGKQLYEYDKSHPHSSKRQRKKFRCLLTDCRKSFKTIENLSEHKVKDHNLMAKFWCVECFNLPFISRDDLNQHSIIFHADNMIQRTNEYPCKYCDKYFLEKNLLSAHQLKHHHLQFLNQTEAKHKSQTTIVRKVVYKSTKSNDNIKSTKGGVCSFKIRPQKEHVTSTRKQHLDIFTKWIGAKYPHFNSKPERSNCVQHTVNKTLVVNENLKEKVLISLPPRKRRQYHAVNQIENFDIVESSEVSDIKENVPQVSNKNLAVEMTAKVLEAPKNVQSNIVADINLVEGTLLPEVDLKCNLLSQESMPHKEETNNEQIAINEVLTVDTSQVDEKVEPLKETNLSDNVKITSQETAVLESIDLTDNSKESKIKMNLPLNTYNCRKRKKQHLKVTRTYNTKRVKENQKAITEENIKNAVQNEELISSAIPEEPVVLPPVVSKTEGNDNDNNPGRITMTISLKAIKQYTNNKEEKRESKRKKKLKGKRKDKQISNLKKKIQDTEIVPIVNDSSNTNSFRDHIILKGCISEATCDNVITSRDISESETETRNEIVLNKDEINMIIFGDTLNTNSLSNDISVINEQIIDTSTEETSSTNNGQINLSDSAPLALLPKSPKKKVKPRGRVGKKRKIKRKPEKILKLTLDADGRVIDKKQFTKSSNAVADTGEETVEGQISNVQLKDHLYARSAFNAFKQSQ